MKPVVFLVAFLMTAFPLAAYQVGKVNRTNFGQGPQQPATQQQYRAFSNYNNRSWGQGVQTQVAGSSVTEFEAPAKSAKPAQAVSKKQVAQAPEAKPGAAVSPAQVPAPASPTQPSSAPAAQTAMPADAAAMIQQVQGLVGAMAPQAGQVPAAGGKPGNQAGAAAMPDISALMGGMMPTQPQPAPVKK